MKLAFSYTGVGVVAVGGERGKFWGQFWLGVGLTSAWGRLGVGLGSAWGDGGAGRAGEWKANIFSSLKQ